MIRVITYIFDFWDKATEYEDKASFFDWSVLDSEAVHAAIAQRCTRNFCDNCHLWYHPPVCVLYPFQLRESGGNMTTGSTFMIFVDNDNSSDKAMDSSAVSR